MDPRQRSDRADGDGFTLIEVLVVLSVVAALAAILTPVVVRYVDDARNQRATSDARVIGSAIGQFYRDLGKGPVFSDASSSADLTVLYGPGDNPNVSGTPGWPSSSGLFDDGDSGAGSLAGQLISNDPGYSTTTPSGVRPGQGVAWEGPYMSEMGADPWGNRYLASVEGFQQGSSEAVFVVSAGPDGVVGTSADQAQAGDLSTGSDDLVFRVR